MNSHVLKTLIAGLLVTLSISTQAQKNIVISDSLLANADQLNVKVGAQGFGKMKMQFGEYTVVSSKLGWTTTSTKGNFFNTKSESNSKEKFSFAMANNKNDTATVDAANYVTTKSTQAIKLSSHFSLGSNELQQWAQNFTAFITINTDTTDTWALLMNGAFDKDAAGKSEAYLSNGNRRVVLVPVSSNKNNDDKRVVPAMGYELIENNQSIAALQYYGGGLLGRNRNIVWIDRRLDQKSKLVLSAALTAVLQLKMSEF